MIDAAFNECLNVLLHYYALTMVINFDSAMTYALPLCLTAGSSNIQQSPFLIMPRARMSSKMRHRKRIVSEELTSQLCDHLARPAKIGPEPQSILQMQVVRQVSRIGTYSRKIQM